MAENSAKRWRAPAPEERQRDAERTRAALLEAALEEFAAKGQAGARVQDIADRAGVNKHLISYYFGGKQGLYRELQRRWVEHERDFAGEDVPLDEVAVRYLRRCVNDPRPTRLMLWNGLEDGPKPEDTPVAQSIRDDLDQIKKRQERGELPAELDPASVRLAVNAMTAAPMLMPHVVRVAFGLDPQSPEFEKRYGEQLRLMIKLLCGDGAPDADD